MKTQEKIAVITGGSSGLGLALAKELSGQGYLPVLIARNQDRLDEAAQEIRMHCQSPSPLPLPLEGGEGKGEGVSGDVLTFQADITNTTELAMVSRRIRERFQTIDFLILNAGMTQTKLLADYTDDAELKKNIEVDLWGTILSTKSFLPFLKNGSKILFISSVLGYLGVAGYSTYAAAKAGIINFAEAIRLELKSKKIQVYVACPPDMDTPQYRKEFEEMPEWMKKQSKGRISVLSADVAAKRILKKCRGDRFLFNITPDTQFFYFLNRILPQAVKDFIVDRIVPRPK